MKKILRCFGQMSAPAYDMLRGTMQVACTMAFCSFMLLLHTGPVCPESREIWLAARELYSNPVGIIFVGGIASVLLEERARR